MTNYKEIIRLHSLGLNKTRIAESCGCARSTVITALHKAEENGLSWNAVKNLSSEEVARKLYPATSMGQGTVCRTTSGSTRKCDERGSFTELVHTADCGQVSINISRPGITKGQHWHNSKWEQFIVVHGHGLIRERNISTGETVEFEVSGDTIEAVYMIPGWTHSIINLSDTEDLVTVMTCNEVFDPNKPDTFFEPV